MALSSWKTSQQKTLTVYLLIRFHFSTLRLTTRKGKFSTLTPSDLFMSLSSPVFSDIGSLYALVLFFVLTNHVGCYLRAESTAVGTFKLPGKRERLFLWWEQDSLARRKKNQSCLYCLLTISGGWTLPILLKASTITTLEAHRCSQQDQLVLCATCDCIGKRDKWRELDLNSTSWYLLFTAVFP